MTEEKEINLNVRDKWDSTPLYYACLCGHPEVVKFLLENGARCDASTFDGERCIYGALTDQIKKMLVSFSVITSRVKRREPFHEFLRRLLEDGEKSDITFIVHGVHIKAHRFILAARSDYFEQQLLHGRWKNKDIVSINHALVRFLVRFEDFQAKSYFFELTKLTKSGLELKRQNLKFGRKNTESNCYQDKSSKK